MSPQDLATFQRSCLVCGLKPDEVATLLPLGVAASYRASEDIFCHRASDGDLYVILQGTVDVLTDDGDKIIEAGPGSVIGEISFLDAGLRDASAVAISHVTALRFPASDLRRKMCGDKEFGFRILCNLSRTLCARMRETEDKLDALMDHAHQVWNTTDL